MITVDCHEVESIQNELLIYVADNVAAIPNIKYHEFVLSPIEDDGVIDSNDVVAAIKEFLESLGQTTLLILGGLSTSDSGPNSNSS